jgi:shikimate 5-dehydrogenase
MSGVEKVTYEQLDDWQPSGTVVAFLGEEAGFHAHIHNLALGALKKERIDLAEWNNVVIQNVDAANLASTLKTLHAKHVWGIIFTSPIKSIALKTISPSFEEQKRGEITLTEEMTEGIGSAEALADRVGAVNLAIWKPRGYWGLSTDGTAFTQAFFDNFKTKLKTKSVVVFGCESFGRAVAVEALSRGATEVWIGGVQKDKAWDAVDQIVPSMNMRGRIHSFEISKPSPKIPQTAIVVNALPIRFRDTPEGTFDLSYFTRLSTYFDTSLSANAMVVQAEKLGIPMSMGKRLVAHQVRLHIKYLTDIDASIDAVLDSVVHISRTQIPF